MQTTKGRSEGNGQASNYISISVGYFSRGLYLLQITNSEIYAHKAEKESVQKVTIKPEEHLVFRFACTAFSQPGLGQHRQKDQPLEIVFNHIT